MLFKRNELHEKIDIWDNKFNGNKSLNFKRLNTKSCSRIAVNRL